MEEKRMLAAVAAVCLAGGVAIGYACGVFGDAPPGQGASDWPLGDLFESPPRLEDAPPVDDPPPYLGAYATDTGADPRDFAAELDAAVADGASAFRVGALLREAVVHERGRGVALALERLGDAAFLERFGAAPVRQALEGVVDPRVGPAVEAVLEDQAALGSARAPELLDLALAFLGERAEELVLACFDDPAHPLREAACERVGAIVTAANLDRLARAPWSRATARLIHARLLEHDEARALQAFGAVARDREAADATRLSAARLVAERGSQAAFERLFHDLRTTDPRGELLCLSVLRGAGHNVQVGEEALRAVGRPFLREVLEGGEESVWVEVALLLRDFAPLRGPDVLELLEDRLTDLEGSARAKDLRLIVERLRNSG